MNAIQGPVRFSRWLLLLLLSMLCVPIGAQEGFSLLITGGQDTATPIAVVPFAWNADGPRDSVDMAEVISSDLLRSGQFNPMKRSQMVRQPSTGEDINFGFWARSNQDYIFVGAVQGNPLDGYTIDYELLNVLSKKSLFSESMRFRAGEFRSNSHLIANRIYEELLGVPGVFHTRIAYITDSGANAGEGFRYQLMVADADGHNPQAIVSSDQPLLSPTWSNDALNLAYVSFERSKSSVVVQNLSNGSREIVADFEGINGAPAFSPDDTKLAMTLSRSGNPEIYVMDLDSRRLTQVTRHWAIDTEAAWSADGQTLYFTSDRGGKPQIYAIRADGSGKATRITRTGDYNARASINESGDLMTLVTGDNNIYKIALYRIDEDILQVISEGPLDESPSFAPNGRMVLYASRQGRQGVLSAMPVYGVSGRTKAVHQLIFAEGSIREPAWAPMPR